MTQVAIQVSNRASAETLVKLLSALDLDFVEQIAIDEINGSRIEPFEPYIGPEYQQMVEEEAAFDRLLPALQQQYLHQFVAIYGQQVVDHDADEQKLLERIDENYPDQVVLLRQVREEREPILFFRSLRLVR